MPELIKQGYVYLAQPPLYRVERNKKFWYAYSDEELNQILMDIGRDHKGDNVIVKNVQNDNEVTDINRNYKVIENKKNVLYKGMNHKIDEFESSNENYEGDEVTEAFMEAEDSIETEDVFCENDPNILYTEDSVKAYLKEIGKIPLLTSEQELATAIRIEDGDNSARERSGEFEVYHVDLHPRRPRSVFAS